MSHNLRVGDLVRIKSMDREVDGVNDTQLMHKWFEENSVLEILDIGEDFVRCVPIHMKAKHAGFWFYRQSLILPPNNGKIRFNYVVSDNPPECNGFSQWEKSLKEDKSKQTTSHIDDNLIRRLEAAIYGNSSAISEMLNTYNPPIRVNWSREYVD